MTINIIQHGMFYEPPDTANCRNCRCIFSYDEKDVTEEKSGGDYVSRFVNCPECRWGVEVEGGSYE